MVLHATRYRATTVNTLILVKTVAGNFAEIREHVHEAGSVLEAHVVAGQYDIAVKAEEVYTGIDTVTTDLRELDGIVHTCMYICLD
jgi:hypothetical protein